MSSKTGNGGKNIAAEQIRQQFFAHPRDANSIPNDVALYYVMCAKRYAAGTTPPNVGRLVQQSPTYAAPQFFARPPYPFPR